MGLFPVPGSVQGPVFFFFFMDVNAIKLSCKNSARVIVAECMPIKWSA
jgi:putative effector of murein hydrolase LrgA (UPF0299 family)